MGTTLHAAIEVFNQKTEHTKGHWWTDVPEVCLGKDYELMNALTEAGASDGWPTLEPDEDREALQWATAEQFLKAVEIAEASVREGYDESHAEIVRGVVALLGVYKRPVRLLFWRE